MQKGFVQFIILGIVVLAIVAAGAFYLGKQTSKPTQPQNQAVTSQATPSPFLTGDETVNWKEYRDEVLKFSIKYPDNLIEVDNLISGADTSPGTYAGFLLKKEANETRTRLKDRVVGNYNWDSGIRIHLSILYRYDGKGVSKKGIDSLSRLVDVECPQPCNENTEEIIINNAVGIKTLGPNYPDDDRSDNYYLANRNKDVIVRVLFENNPTDPFTNSPLKYGDNSPEVMLFRKMITTFRFLE